MKKILCACKGGAKSERVEKWNLYTWDWDKMKKTKKQWEDDGFMVFIYEVKEDAEI